MAWSSFLERGAAPPVANERPAAICVATAVSAGARDTGQPGAALSAAAAARGLFERAPVCNPLHGRVVVDLDCPQTADGVTKDRTEEIGFAAKHDVRAWRIQVCKDVVLGHGQLSVARDVYADGRWSLGLTELYGARQIELAAHAA